MKNWHMSKSNMNNTSDDAFDGKMEQLRTFLAWIVEQSDETPIKYIKELAKEQYSHLEEIETKNLLETQLLLNQKSKIIEDLKQENANLETKMTLSVQDIINTLQNNLEKSTREIDRLNEILADLKVWEK